ncbi:MULTISPECIES: hypothetical protein [Streptomyces]|jgi:hypothetical protein|uniref:Uncharacterized protein n=2 Tax=Streptomyces TaxID=1883 RepID=A0A514JTD5_9ACTN|nr:MULTISPECIES: hypothetical protein [Streptomyces]MBA8945226.1 hypothetical protein [Streptomyces calvus]MBA8977856.1 hypothetical protein [Streptomyces calvus]MYS27219.1 hypothetical protein [Streptomyces sp. SID7804]QDI70631.1 hypothetical protein CD934_19515 [Streptomyces calvus]GGP47851.1 hypothetical protein GCM10010247_20310 [Streptomyces calvus]
MGMKDQFQEKSEQFQQQAKQRAQQGKEQLQNRGRRRDEDMDEPQRGRESEDRLDQDYDA